MLYRVVIRVNKERKNIDFELNDSPVTQLWVDLVRRQQAGIWAISHTHWTRVWPTQEFKDRCLAQLAEMAQKMELTDSEIPTLVAALERARADKDPTPLWVQIRTVLDKLKEQEQTLAHPELWRCGFGFYLEAQGYDAEQCPIPNEHRHLWGHTPKSGDLLLGPHTQGISILDCYQNKDTEAVREGRVQAPLTIGTGVQAFWGTDNTRVWPTATHEDVVKWMEDNGIDKYVDMGLAENQYHSQPVLGCYVGEYTEQEINEFLLTAQLVTCELLE